MDSLGCMGVNSESKVKRILLFSTGRLMDCGSGNIMCACRQQYTCMDVCTSIYYEFVFSAGTVVCVEEALGRNALWRGRSARD